MEPGHNQNKSQNGGPPKKLSRLPPARPLSTSGVRPSNARGGPPRPPQNAPPGQQIHPGATPQNPAGASSNQSDGLTNGTPLPPWTAGFQTRNHPATPQSFETPGAEDYLPNLKRKRFIEEAKRKTEEFQRKYQLSMPLNRSFEPATQDLSQSHQNDQASNPTTRSLPEGQQTQAQTTQLVPLNSPPTVTTVDLQSTLPELCLRCGGKRHDGGPWTCTRMCQHCSTFDHVGWRCPATRDRPPQPGTGKPESAIDMAEKSSNRLTAHKDTKDLAAAMREGIEATQKLQEYNDKLLQKSDKLSDEISQKEVRLGELSARVELEEALMKLRSSQMAKLSNSTATPPPQPSHNPEDAGSVYRSTLQKLNGSGVANQSIEEANVNEEVIGTNRDDKHEQVKENHGDGHEK